MRGRSSHLTITLTTADAGALAALQRSTARVPAGLMRRSKIVTLRAQGLSLSDISRRMGLSRRTVYRWLTRYQAHGLDGLQARYAGRPRKDHV